MWIESWSDKKLEQRSIQDIEQWHQSREIVTMYGTAQNHIRIGQQSEGWKPDHTWHWINRMFWFVRRKGKLVRHAHGDYAAWTSVWQRDFLDGIRARTREHAVPLMWDWYEAGDASERRKQRNVPQLLDKFSIERTLRWRWRATKQKTSRWDDVDGNACCKTPGDVWRKWDMENIEARAWYARVLDSCGSTHEEQSRSIDCYEERSSETDFTLWRNTAAIFPTPKHGEARALRESVKSHRAQQQWCEVLLYGAVWRRKRRLSRLCQAHPCKWGLLTDHGNDLPFGRTCWRHHGVLVGTTVPGDDFPRHSHRLGKRSTSIA